MTNAFDDDVQSDLSRLRPRELSEDLEERILQQLETPLPAAKARSRPRRLPSISVLVGAGAVAALVIAVIWISNLAVPGAREAANRPNADSPSVKRLEVKNNETASDRENGVFSRRIENGSQGPSEQRYVLSRRPEWRNVSAIGAHADMLYVVDNGRLYEVNPMDESYRVVGNDNWPNTTTVGVASANLYIVSDNQLYIVNPTNGARRRLGEPHWSDTEAIATVGDILYIVSDDRLYQVSPGDGSRELLLNKNEKSRDDR